VTAPRGPIPGPLSWIPGLWWPYLHAVPTGTPETLLANGQRVRFGLCGLATALRTRPWPRGQEWPRCPECKRRWVSLGHTNRADYPTDRIVLHDKTIRRSQ